MPGNSWVQSCQMHKNRRFAASTVMPDQTFVVLGGYNNNEGWLDSVESTPGGSCEFTLQKRWVLCILTRPLAGITSEYLWSNSENLLSNSGSGMSTSGIVVLG